MQKWLDIFNALISPLFQGDMVKSQKDKGAPPHQPYPPRQGLKKWKVFLYNDWRPGPGRWQLGNEDLKLHWHFLIIGVITQVR